ncbi:hypothetical protein FQN54_004112 [Arachnomyces sp. PD_36]|nr:hypothetical protein FQN54_004112 [Arachnomyces sp. PD_36]
MSRNNRTQMSLEAALDEERIEIMNLLEGRPKQRPTSPGSAHRHASPAPAVRSMLDVAPDLQSTKSSSATGAAGGAGPASASSSNSSLHKVNTSGHSVRSMLDPTSPSPLRLTHSTASSPTDSKAPASREGETLRRSSDAANTLPETRRRFGGKHVDIDQEYSFEMLPSNPHHAMPKRVSQGGKKSGGGAAHSKGAMAAMMGGDLGFLPGGFTRGRDTGRHNSTVGIGGHSRSPSSRLGRSRSPGLNNNSFNMMSTPGKFVTEGGKVIDMENAYRRLSNTALSKSRGSLSSRFGRDRGDSGESLSETGEPRLEKDYYGEGGSEAIDTSDEDDEDDYSSGDEDWRSEIPRGRRRHRKKESENGTTPTPANMGRAKGDRQVQSLLAAAEEEREKVSSTYKVKSLLDPAPPSSRAAVEKSMAKKSGVHPTTSFDYTASAANTPAGSEDEADLCDLKKAQNLSINMSTIDNSIPNRVIRTIVRGDFALVQEEADQGHLRQRKYLVATDLSEESVYALEWTIGTILRDGDTLYAVYAVDEETGTGNKAISGSEVDTCVPVQIGEGAKLMEDTAAIIGSQTITSTPVPAGNPGASAPTFPSPHTSSSRLGVADTDSKSGSVDSRVMSKPEMERFNAAERISQTCVRLLRKTRLQVRVAVEVIHCKSPKHMITEAIDGLEPTLVILGSRGRSALKGVLLGSFSNYLVTKSSVPVMVARKKLRKHAKYKNTNIRLSNNLTTPKKLAQAKID